MLKPTKKTQKNQNLTEKTISTQTILKWEDLA